MSYFDQVKKLSDEKAYSEALTICEEWCHVEPENAKSWYNLGVVSHFNHDNTSALKAFSTCISLDETHALAYSNLGSTLCCMNKFESAVPHFKKAVNLSEEGCRADIISKLVDCYLNLEQYQLATPLINQLYKYDEVLALQLEGKMVREIIPGRKQSWWQRLFDKMF